MVGVLSEVTVKIPDLMELTVTWFAEVSMTKTFATRVLPAFAELTGKA